MKFETKAIRTQTPRTPHREHATPIFPTSSFVFNDAEQMRALFAEEEKGNIYSRFSNPTVAEFEDKMALLEGSQEAVATATGMAAVHATIAGLLQQGDHIISSRAIFGSSYQLMVKYLIKFGITCSFVDATAPENWEKEVRPNSRMLFLETPSNPGLAIIDLEWAAKFAKSHNLISVVDNCFATPYLQQPIQWGVDLVIHSATKFIDGQGRVLGGVVCGPSKFIDPIFRFIRNSGPSLSPFNAWILSKSLETLSVRMDRHCSNAENLALRLVGHPALSSVNYPFLPSHPQETIARQQMTQGGGLITFELQDGQSSGIKFLNALQMCSLSANLGDTRTIVSHPASTTHSKVPVEEREKIGITEGLVRISVGLEHVDDIYTDVLQALDKVNHT